MAATRTRRAAWATLATAQGITYVATGLWPIVHLRSFEAVTGPKLEGWLVKTAGALVTSIGVALLVGASRRERASVTTLGLTAAASLAAIDFTYASRRRIAPVYFADGAFEAALACGWALVAARRPRDA